MASQDSISPSAAVAIECVAQIGREKVLNPSALPLFGGIRPETPVLVILAAGKGTRFGQSPKCIQPVHGTPLARHSIDAFRAFCAAPVVCLVGYRHDEVSAALGPDNVYVRSDNPAGGTWTVYGAGQATIYRHGVSQTYPRGETFSLSPDPSK